MLAIVESGVLGGLFDTHVLVLNHLEGSLQAFAVPQGLKKISGYYESVRGRIESDWSVEGDSFTLRVQIPVNSTARVYFPSGYLPEESNCLEQASKAGVIAVECVDGCSVLRIGSGEYHFAATHET